MRKKERVKRKGEIEERGRDEITEKEIYRELYIKKKRELNKARDIFIRAREREREIERDKQSTRDI